MKENWIDEKIKEARQNEIDHGFYPEGTERNIAECLMLIVSELSEAMEADRKGRFADWLKYEEEWGAYWQEYGTEFKAEDKNHYFEMIIKDTFEDEIADTFIRLFGLCGYMKIDIVKHIEAKMAYNKTREFKHGGKKY